MEHNFFEKIERGLVIGGAAFTFAQVLNGETVQATDLLSSQQTSEHTTSLQTEPEPTPVIEVMESVKGMIGTPEQFSSGEFLDYVEKMMITEEDKNSLREIVESTDRLALTIADSGWNEPNLATIQSQVSSHIQVTKLENGSALVNGYVINSEALSRDGKTIKPDSVLIGYQLDGEVKVDGVYADNGETFMFVPSASEDRNNSNRKMALITVFSDEKGTVTDKIAVFDSEQGVILEPVSKLIADISGNPSNLMEFPATVFNDQVGTELAKLIKPNSPFVFNTSVSADEINSVISNVSTVESSIPSIQSLNLALSDREIISKPELVGNPSLITNASVRMPNGSQLQVNIYGDIPMLTDSGFKLFKYEEASQQIIQDIADKYLLDTPNVIPVLSVNDRLEYNSQNSNQLQDGNSIHGESVFNVDLTKPVTVILTKESLPESVSFSAYLDRNGRNTNQRGVFIEPREDGMLVMYVNLMGVNQDLNGFDWLVALNSDGSLLNTFGYIRFFQSQMMNGESSPIKLSSAFHALRQTQTEPMSIIGNSKFQKEIIPLAEKLVAVSKEIK